MPEEAGTIQGECMGAVQLALCGSYRLSLCDGQVEVLCRPLPGRAIATATVYGGILWVVIDLDKASAALHARDMVTAWFAGRVVVAEQGDASCSSYRKVCDLSLVP